MAADIYGTLGPACSDEDTLMAMLQSGMTGVRLNLSHTTLADAAPQIRRVLALAERCGVSVRLLTDLRGPELRVGPLKAPVELLRGDAVRLGPGGLPVPEAVLPHLRPGQRVLLDDGKLLLTVTGGRDARVDRGGVLRSRKSLALEGVEVTAPALTAEDREDLALAGALGVTGVMQPFVRGAADLREVRAAMEAAGCPHLRLLAKIENRAGAEKLPELLTECDEIVIARGDLGNAVPLWELPGLQKRIAAVCRAAGVPFMVVTQMLASMESRPVPTRAEVSDVFNAVLDGAASVMLTGETAAGAYPAEAMAYMVKTVRAAERFLAEKA